MTITDIVKELRIENDMTQSDLANKLCCNRQKIADWERNKSSPTMSDLIPLSKIFNVSIDYLMGITDMKTSDIKVKDICNYTGLHENIVLMLNELNEIKQMTNSTDIQYIDILNLLLNPVGDYQIYLKTFFDSAVCSVNSVLKESEIQDNERDGIHYSEFMAYRASNAIQNLLFYNAISSKITLDNVSKWSVLNDKYYKKKTKNEEEKIDIMKEIEVTIEKLKSDGNI